jgi:hypothetical protein
MQTLMQGVVTGEGGVFIIWLYDKNKRWKSEARPQFVKGWAK